MERRFSEGGSIILPDTSSGLILIPAFVTQAGSEPIFLCEYAGGVVLERLLEQVLPIAQELRLNVMGAGDNSRILQLFKSYDLAVMPVETPTHKRGQHLLPPGTEETVKALMEGQSRYGVVLVVSPYALFLNPQILFKALSTFCTQSPAPLFSVTLETEPIYNLNDENGPFSIEALWHYDDEAGRMFNRLSGRHFYRRQDAPRVFRADRVISIFRLDDVHRFDLLIDQGKAHPFVVEEPSYVVLSQGMDLIKSEIMTRLHMAEDGMDDCRDSST